jgi:ankyrin repeat protein
MENIDKLFKAAQDGDLDKVNDLLKEGANPNATKFDGATPLFIASQNGHIEVVKVLLENGADPNKARTDGSTPS